MQGTLGMKTRTTPFPRTSLSCCCYLWTGGRRIAPTQLRLYLRAFLCSRQKYIKSNKLKLTNKKIIQIITKFSSISNSVPAGSSSTPSDPCQPLPLTPPTYPPTTSRLPSSSFQAHPLLQQPRSIIPTTSVLLSPVLLQHASSPA